MRRGLYALVLAAAGILRTVLLAANASSLAADRDLEGAMVVRFYAIIQGVLLWVGLGFLLLVAFRRLRVLGWVGFTLATVAELSLLVPFSIDGSILAGTASVAALVGVTVAAVRQSRGQATR